MSEWNSVVVISNPPHSGQLSIATFKNPAVMNIVCNLCTVCNLWLSLLLVCSFVCVCVCVCVCVSVCVCMGMFSGDIWAPFIQRDTVPSFLTITLVGLEKP